MKAVCISACEIDKFGIVTQGEEVELPDAYANDVRIKQHFVIDRATIKNPDAKLPDYEKEDSARREKFEKSLQDESKWLDALNRLIDEGVELPAEVIESGRLTDQERIKKLVDLWIDDFGYEFPTDPKPQKPKGDKDKGNKKPKDKKGNEDQGSGGEGTGEPDPKDPKDKGAAGEGNQGEDLFSRK